MSFYSVKLEKINNNAYGFMDEFDDSPTFTDSTVIRVAFRTLGSRKHEHYLNTYAAKLTRARGEKFPAGSMTHTELIVTLRPNVYLKASVIKKSFNGKDENGNILWKKGCVHLKKTDPREWQNQYVFLTLHADRRDIKRMTEFLVQQNGQDFNHKAYYANLLVPGGPGVRYYSDDLMHKAKPFFCTQFIVCGLQCLMLSSAYKGLTYSEFRAYYFRAIFREFRGAAAIFARSFARHAAAPAAR
jgi:hypothetical protein